MRDLDGKTSLVTGASRGIGRAISVALAARGARVALGGRDETALAETAAEINGNGGHSQVLSLDVTSETAVAEAVKTILATWGRLDHLVNNAGMTVDGLLMRARGEDWDRVIDTNLGGTFRMSRAALRPMLRARSGRIVSISSVIGEMGNSGQTLYAASKAGIIGFTKSLAREVASRSVTVNCVAPGFIDTDMTRAMPESARDELLADIPLGRAGTPAEIAEGVCFLLSDAAAYITGAVLRINGGLLM
ncbi:MAG: 3-oxoacyl-[acyl-carrier-protein] reductase [Acidobacteriota bacterium]